MTNQIAIIGGGAAGFFAAVNIKEAKPDLQVVIYEGSGNFMGKILVSGGGRCNVTNAEEHPDELIKAYPRGHAFLKPAFERFNTSHTASWFEERQVPLKVEADGRVFPRSNSSQSIYNVLYREAQRLGVEIKAKQPVKEIQSLEEGFRLDLGGSWVEVDKVVVCTGSSRKVWKMLEALSISIVDPVPSLFTFKTKESGFSELAGVVAAETAVYYKELQQVGPLLFTHQGLSGPAILKMSAWGARQMHKDSYSFPIAVCWNTKLDREHTLKEWAAQTLKDPKAKVINWKGHGLPKRLWKMLVERSNIKEYTNWAELGKKGIKRLNEQLFRCPIQIEGKNTFKEEFVTAGGVDLSQVHPLHFESKQYPGLYFAGEVLNIDAVTGGYNFQAAWTVAYLISRAV